MCYCMLDFEIDLLFYLILIFFLSNRVRSEVMVSLNSFFFLVLLFFWSKYFERNLIKRNLLYTPSVLL